MRLWHHSGQSPHNHWQQTRPEGTSVHEQVCTQLQNSMKSLPDSCKVAPANNKDGLPAMLHIISRQAPNSTRHRCGLASQLHIGPSHSTSVLGAIGDLSADDVQHGGEPFLFLGLAGALSTFTCPCTTVLCVHSNLRTNTRRDENYVTPNNDCV